MDSQSPFKIVKRKEFHAEIWSQQKKQKHFFFWNQKAQSLYIWFKYPLVDFFQNTNHGSLVKTGTGAFHFK